MAFNEIEKKIILQGKTSGKSLAEVKNAIIKYRSGIRPPTQSAQTESDQPSGFVATLKDAPSDIYGGVKKAGERFLQTGEDIVDIAQQKDRSIAEKATMIGGKAFGGGAGAIGELTLGAAKAVVSPATEEKVKSTLLSGVESVMANGTVQDAVKYVTDKYNALPPDAQEQVDAAGGFASALLEIVGAKGAGKVTGAGKRIATEGIETGIESGKQILQKTGQLATDIVEGVAESKVGGALGGVIDEASRIPSRISTNIATKQATREAIQALPTKTARMAVQDGIDIADVQKIAKIAPQNKSIAKELVDTVKKFAKGETDTNPIEVVGRPITQKLKEVDAKLVQKGKEIGEVSKNLGVVTAEELQTPVFNSLKKVPGLDGLTVDKNGVLNFKNTVLTTAETASDRKAIQSIYKQATKWGNGEAKHKLRQELFEVLDGKKKSLTQLTGTQEKAYQAIRQGLADVLDAKNPKYKALNQEYAKMARPLSDLRKMMKGVAGATDEDVLDMASGLLARRLTSNAPSNPQIRAILKALDEATSGTSKESVEGLQDLYNILNRYYDIAGETSFQGGIKSGIESSNISGMIGKTLRNVAGESDAVRQKAIENLLEELLK